VLAGEAGTEGLGSIVGATDGTGGGTGTEGTGTGTDGTAEGKGGGDTTTVGDSCGCDGDGNGNGVSAVGDTVTNASTGYPPGPGSSPEGQPG